MTAYTTLSDTALSQDKPLTQSTARAFRDNPLAIAEGDSTAPKIQPAAIDTDSILVAGSVPIWWDGYGNTLTRYSISTGNMVTNTAICKASGTITVRADFGPSTSGSYAVVYKNGTGQATWTNVDDTAFTTTFSVAVGDVVYLRLLSTEVIISMWSWRIMSNSTDHIGYVI
jgi:hypothetical protein